MEMQVLPHPMSGAMEHTGTGPLLFCSDITSKILLYICLSIHSNYQQSCVTVGTSVLPYVSYKGICCCEGYQWFSGSVVRDRV